MEADTPASRATQSLSLASLDHVLVVPVLSPWPTVLEAARDVVSDRPGMVLEPQERRRARRDLGERDLRSLRALAPSGMPSDGGPNELLDARSGATMREEEERLSATDPGRIAATIEQHTAYGRPTEPWEVVRRAPGAWLAGFVEAIHTVWTHVQPQWLASTAQLEAEVLRVEALAERVSVGDLLAATQSVGEVHDRTLDLPSHTRSSGMLRVRGDLQLLPLLARRTSGTWGDEDDDVLVSLRFSPLGPATSAAGDDADLLAALLGRQRAAVLRRLSDARSPSQLACALQLSPSAISYQLAALERAGLVVRGSHGRVVRVRRTARATRLVELYGG